MSNSMGWICLHRTIQDHFLWDDKPFTKGQAWIDLLLLANHADVKVLCNGNLTEFQRGTVHKSILELSKRWGWDRKKVTRFLKILELDEMITLETSTHGSEICILNYDKFQNKPTEKEENMDENKQNQEQEQEKVDTENVSFEEAIIERMDTTNQILLSISNSLKNIDSWMGALYVKGGKK